MKKLALNLDRLTVESFTTESPEEGRGTVHANQISQLCSGFATCNGPTCNWATCNGPTCNQFTCNGGVTCYYTCGQNTCTCP